MPIATSYEPRHGRAPRNSSEIMLPRYHFDVSLLYEGATSGAPLRLPVSPSLSLFLSFLFSSVLRSSNRAREWISPRWRLDELGELKDVEFGRISVFNPVDMKYRAQIINVNVDFYHDYNFHTSKCQIFIYRCHTSS